MAFAFVTVAAIIAVIFAHATGQGVDQSPSEVFSVGTPSFFGSGCPRNTTAFAPTSNNGTFSVIFFDFVAVATGTKTRQRVSCNMAVNIDAQSGFSVGVYASEFTGNVFVPSIPEAYAQINSESFFAGGKGPVINLRFDPDTDKDLVPSKQSPQDRRSIVWSPCGASTNYRVNTATTAYRPVSPSDEEVEIAVTSMFDAGFKTYFTAKKCHH